MEFREPPPGACVSAPGAVPPGVALVPDEVMQEGRFDGERRRRQVIHVRQAYQRGQHRDLHEDSHGADRVELQPTQAGLARLSPASQPLLPV